MIFHVSTGRSASLKLQSNFSSATGSSVGSWYGARYSCARASVAVILFFGSKTSILSSMSTAAGSAFLNLFFRGWRSRLGSDLTNRSVLREEKKEVSSTCHASYAGGASQRQNLHFH